MFKGKSQVKSYQVYNESKTNGEEETRLEKKERAPGKGEERHGQGCNGLAPTGVPTRLRTWVG